MRAAPSLGFFSSLWRISGTGAAWLVVLSFVPIRSESAEVAVPGSRISLEYVGDAPTGGEALAQKWLENAGRAIAVYFDGEFPVRGAVVRMAWANGRRAGRGQAFGHDGPLVKINLGREATAAILEDDWMLTHELVHLTFPSVAARHHWIEEGLATYVEPIARVRAGQLTAAGVWFDMVEGMPKGQPAAGDRGLDFTHTWGRTYWGGALFCLRADIEIRRRTANRFGLEHALRAIVKADGTIEATWPIDRVIAVGDAATGVPVLRELYDETKAAPAPVDLEALWKQLGVIPRVKTVEFDDTAPLAAVRKAIMAR
jgi:hypothetical protein